MRKKEQQSILITSPMFFFFKINTEDLVPVRMDWSTLSVVDLMEVRRISAGTLSPTNKITNKTIKISRWVKVSVLLTQSHNDA